MGTISSEDGALAHLRRLTGPILLALLSLSPWPARSQGVPPPGLLDEGRALLQARAYELALNRFLLIEKKSGNDGERALALRMVGETQFRNGDYASAFQAYQKSLLLTPLSSSRLSLEFKEAVSLVYLKKYASALGKLSALEGRVKDKGFLTDLYFWEGECYYQLGRYDEAHAEYGKIFATNMRYRYVYLVRYLDSWCDFEQKDYDAALKGFGEVGAKTDDPVLKKLSDFQVAEALYRAGRYPEAEKAYAAFADRYAGDRLGTAARYGLGWSLEKEKKYPDAVKAFAQVVSDAPQDPLAPWAAVREGVDAAAVGQAQTARDSYLKALDLSPGSAPADQAQFGLGWLDFSAKDYDRASARFRKVEGFQPESGLKWDAAYLRAGAAYLVGDYPGAVKVYAACAAGAPQDLAQASRFWMAWCDYHIGHYQEALDAFQGLAQGGAGPWKARAFWGAGESAYQLTQYDQACGFYQNALQSDNCPVSQECYSGIGWSRFEQEKYQDAFNAFQKSASIAPGSALGMEARLRAGDCQYNLHQYGPARAQYSQLLGGPAPYGLDAQEQLAWCDYRQEAFDKAVDGWRKLSQDPGAQDRRPRLYYWMAWAYFRAGEFAKAADQFKAVEDSFPKDPLAPESHLREGDCYFNLKDFRSAKQVYLDFLNRYPDHPLVPDALYGLQWSADKLGEKDEAAKEAQDFLAKYPGSPYSPDIELRLADAQFHGGDYAQAVTQYQDLIQRFPQSGLLPRAYFWMGTGLVKVGRPADAAQAFQKVVQQYPTDPLALESRFSLASLDFEAKDYAKALQGYQGIVDQYPDQRLAPHALFNSAVCEKQLGKVDRAVDDFARLSQDYPSDPLAFEAQVQRGILLEQEDRQEDALAAYAQAAKAPDRSLAVEAAYYHADLRRRMGGAQKAIGEFNALIASFPEQDQWVVTAMAQIAQCYEDLKQYGKAYQAYERILKYTKDKDYRAATEKHMRALKPFLTPTTPPAKHRAAGHKTAHQEAK